MKGLLFVYGLTYGGAILALFRPWYGLLAYICFSILRPDHLWFWSVPAGNYTKILAIAVIIGWVISGFGTWDLRGARWPLCSLMLFWLSICVSTLQAPFQDVAWAYLNQFAKILLPLVIGFTLIDSEKRLRELAWVWLLSLGFVAYEANLDHLMGGYRLRLNGFFGVDNNSSCVALVSGVGLAFFLGLAEKVWWRRWLAWVISGLLAHSPMFGDSRGGMLGLLAAGCVAFVLVPKSPRTLSMFAVGLICALYLAGPSVWARFSTAFASGEARDTSAQSRIDLWQDCWMLMTKYPLTGYGPDHFPYAAKYQLKWGYFKEAHMLWLGIGAELGFPGLIGILSYYLGVCLQLVSRVYRRHFESEWQDFAARGTVAALAGFLVSACFVALDAMEPPYFIAMFGAGLVRVSDCLRLQSVQPQTGWGEFAGQAALSPFPAVSPSPFDLSRASSAGPASNHRRF
jgi:putative inorganic carbon (HCO3(-)) transporter